MTSAHRRYVATETMIAATISAVLSVVFTLLIFGSRAVVPIGGGGGLIVDALPQSAIIALMSSLVPTVLTRRRMRAGGLALRTGGVWRPRNAVTRALIVTIGVAAMAGIVHRLLLPIGPARWPFAAVLAYKPLYGALLGGAIARWATIAALTDPVAPPSANRPLR